MKYAAEVGCLVFTFYCMFTGRPGLAIMVCLMGSALCVVNIGKRDGWL